MNIKEALEEALKEIGNKVVVDAKSNLKKNNKLASGNLYNSIKYNIEKSKLSFEMLQYGYWVDKGRKPGKGVPVDELKKWMKLKNIDMKYSYVINRKIKEKGIKPTFFFTMAYEKNTKDIDDILDKYIVNLFDVYIK